MRDEPVSVRRIEEELYLREYARQAENPALLRSDQTRKFEEGIVAPANSRGNFTMERLNLFFYELDKQGKMAASN
ncbi:MAG: hypothetical protein EOP32_33705 [Rhodococcus sp. (in: high G+C Gram-positive bacteria)]|nr:MAG: hypothetical protein EOP32_33705 [Rhodococcus sp. (in: high G+C Gram-positive bacteria)]